MRKKLIPIFVWCIATFSLFSVYSENVRGPVIGTLMSGDTSSIDLSLEDLGIIRLDTLDELVQGIELQFEIPMEMRKYRDSFALLVYKAVRPVPSEQNRSYSGNRICFEVLPSRQTAYYQIPLIPSHSLVGTRDTTVLPRVSSAEFPLLLTVLPVMKGIPSTVSKSSITVRVKKILEEKGYLSLSLSSRKGEDISEMDLQLQIDGNDFPPGKEKFILDIGVHEIILIKDQEILARQSFVIEKGQTTALALDIKERETSLFVEAPEETKLYLDGKKLTNPGKNPITLPPGEHTVVGKIGDYSVSKTFIVEKGKSYTISLFLDILLKEN